jgi:PPM family protein phosphatase
MKISVGAKTDVGLVREGNEDSYLVEEPLFVVADGMGGHLAGDVASSIAVDVIARRAQDTDLSEEDGLRTAVREANAAIWERSQDDSALRGMGTTCTLVLVVDSEARFAHVGDSRAYLFREGELSQLTEDHTLVGRMVREGRLTAEEAEHHPQRSIITRALGVDSDVAVDTFSQELIEGDRLLICSDGLTSMAPADAIAGTLSSESDPQRAAESLVQLAIEHGGEDNVTVVILDVGGGGASASVDHAGKRVPAAVPPPAALGVEDPASGPEDTVAPPEAAPVLPEPPSRSVETSGRRRWAARLIVGVLILGLLAVGGYFLTRALLNRSFYVGLDDAGLVTLYRGIPDEIAGFSFKEVEQHTDISVDDLPEFLQDDVEEGIKADSLAEAEETVANLEQRVRDRRETNTRKKKPN